MTDEEKKMDISNITWTPGEPVIICGMEFQTIVLSERILKRKS